MTSLRERANWTQEQRDTAHRDLWHPNSGIANPCNRDHTLGMQESIDLQCALTATREQLATARTLILEYERRRSKLQTHWPKLKEMYDFLASTESETKP